MISYDEALALLKEYNQGEFHLKHAYIVSDVMGWFAEQLGYGEEKEFWSIVGLLHDLDFEMWFCIVPSFSPRRGIIPRTDSRGQCPAAAA